MFDIQQVLESANAKAYGIVKITDAESGEVVRHVQNAVHFGNLSAAIAKALAGDDDGHIRWMAFGNGGTSITSEGTIFYRAANVSTIRDESADLYNETYRKDISVDTDQNNITVILTNSNFADIKMTATLDFGEPAGQDILDNATSNDGDFVFDEIGIRTFEDVLITHVLFHPVQKSLNRIFEVEYTLRIIMGP